MSRLGFRKKYKGSPLILPILALCSLIIIFFVSLLSSLVVMKQSDPLSIIDPSALVTLIISGIISGILCERVTGDIKQTLVCVGISGAIILLCGLVFGNLGCAFMNALCFFGAGSACGFLSKSFFEKKRRRR